MAIRICFISQPSNYSIYKEVEIDFKYFSGFSISQKQKSIASLHEGVRKFDKNLNVLEVSTKSPNPIGVALSAFNLKFADELTGREYPLENIFQSSKVFENGGPYRDLLNVHPRDAKRDGRLRTSGRLTGFSINDVFWENEPKTMFYDWLYIRSLLRNSNLSKKLLEYNAFTDIEFNQEKSINCQARSAAIFVSLSKLGKFEEVFINKQEFRKIYVTGKNEQFSFFDH